MKTAAELREGFLCFFEERGHVRRPWASIIPPVDDPTTLFIVAGMQPMKRWFLGLEQPAAPRVTTVQKCVRAGGKQNDLDDVGLTNRHLCFMEMLGNFSFGDYFKDGAIELAWEFVTERLSFEPERLWATVFAGDPELGLGEVRAGVRLRALPRVLEPRVHGVRPRRGRDDDPPATAEHRHRHGPRARRDARPGGRVAVRHRQLSAGARLD